MMFKDEPGIKDHYAKATDLSACEEGEGHLPKEYYQAIFDFADSWAVLMEGAVANGETVPECAERMSKLARGHSDLTGYMYGWSVQLLATYWVRGDELRVWHNAKYDVGAEEKGTVNPAIITIGVKK